MNYRLKIKEKESIARNLVAFMESDEVLSRDAAIFIGNWILTDRKEKTKAYFDVWDIVLKNYMPKTRPVLFRSCARLVDNKIASFTGEINCAHRFSEGKGLLLICDTKDSLFPLSYTSMFKRGEYRNTFFSIAELLRKESQSPDSKFGERLIKDYVKEDEYIMRVNLGHLFSCKWYD